ncbi:mitochondrial transcription termination factor family protein [Citrus sinensis]|uniref:Mitochondrial transcription termination factor family protein n=1 Tax=Citrus sinensis TaxID=2711 RepID=A0ACB8M6J2_CITSI|nr:mitochondrial transcription termination factor family protein [Citrus sinensis]
MYGLFYRSNRRLSLAQVLSSSNRSIAQDLATSYLDLFSGLGLNVQNARLFNPFGVKLFSTEDEQIKRKVPKECSFTVSCLINSRGLSPKIAKSVAERVKLQSSKQPDSVLQFLKNRGFNGSQIAKLVRVRPQLLFAHPERSLLPKIEFLNSIGATDAELADVCSSIPAILDQSLENVLIPNYKFLKNLGMPEAYFALILSCYPPIVLQRQDKFYGNVKKVIKMGFDPQKCEFVHAMQVFSSIGQSTLECKLDVLRRWGWSDEDISVFNFLVNKMGWQPSAIAHVPSAFMYSLERRIIPRCSVIRVLLSKGLINEENKICLSSLVINSNKRFLDTFVTKYQDHVPQLLNKLL